MSDNIQQNYEIFMTADGSPTYLFRNEEVQETMHNRAGALSETDWIYGEATRICFQSYHDFVSCFSLGLGLGYNELMFAAHCVLLQKSNVFLYTVESDESLKIQFLQFLSNPKTDCIYEQILLSVARKYNVEAQSVKNFLTELLKNKAWVLQDKLNRESIPQSKFHLIFYDAFSSKTNPELWSDDFLSAFLLDTTEDFCIFSTYAATGSLKRNLKKNGFEIPFREGFHGKRECTLAIKHPKC